MWYVMGSGAYFLFCSWNLEFKELREVYPKVFGTLFPSVL